MITQPIAFIDADSKTVSAYDALPPASQLGSYWLDKALDGLRSRVKDHYVAIQKHRCCYCAMQLLTSHGRSWDVEHVVSRDSHPAFMFVPQNLAASCPDCNNAKSNKEVMINKKRKTYPLESKAFRIVHPHFDDWSEHIWSHNLLFAGKTHKGTETIYMCNLLRYAQRFIDWKNSASDKRFEMDVDNVFAESGQISEAAVESIVDTLRQI